MNSRPVRAGALLAVAALFPSVALAQDNNAERCRSEAVARGVTLTGLQSDPCRAIAFEILERNTQLLLGATRAYVPPRDLQSRASGESLSGGLVAQSEAVPTVQPLALAGGSLSALGSGGGSDGVAAFTLNPAVLFGGMQDPDRVAELSRLMDLTVLAPVNDLDADGNGKIDYFGVRARLNITGPSSGRDIFRKAAANPQVQAAARALAEITQAETDAADALTSDLLAAPDFDACIAAYMAEIVDVAAARDACGRVIEIEPPPTLIEQFRTAIAQARDQADSYYIGLDLRFDHGDPTLGEEDAVRGTAIFGGVAFGRQYGVEDGPSYGFRGRLGLLHVSLDEASIDESLRTNTALDGAFGFVFTQPHDFSPLTLSAGLEFRTGDPPVDAMEEEFRTNYLQARLSIDVPIVGGNSLSLGFGKSISGDVSSALSISFNWQMLLASLATPGPGR